MGECGIMRWQLHAAAGRSIFACMCSVTFCAQPASSAVVFFPVPRTQAMATPRVLLDKSGAKMACLLCNQVRCLVFARHCIAMQVS